mmetsp:Transcript_23994/g.44519  ORF Transcript_23994/g.44519 Transcript_23994/m.44519 type:complete len:181 (+) Transcript_23994:998-1540(+)
MFPCLTLVTLFDSRLLFISPLFPSRPNVSDYGSEHTIMSAFYYGKMDAKRTWSKASRAVFQSILELQPKSWGYHPYRCLVPGYTREVSTQRRPIDCDLRKRSTDSELRSYWEAAASKGVVEEHGTVVAWCSSKCSAEKLRYDTAAQKKKNQKKKSKSSSRFQTKLRLLETQLQTFCQPFA